MALKVLPDELAQDAERLARFEREAKLLASLNHANIATLHGLERVEEIGELPFLVMELVDGDDLAIRLAAGPLPIREALELARQVAGGLGAAHAKGVVHRDLKPANVGISTEGVVKILDFGLAKALQSLSDEVAPDEAPTLEAGALAMDGRSWASTNARSPAFKQGF